MDHPLVKILGDKSPGVTSQLRLIMDVNRQVLMGIVNMFEDKPVFGNYKKVLIRREFQVSFFSFTVCYTVYGVELVSSK